MADAASAAGLRLLCSNVARSGNSWGTHENYECTASFDDRQLAFLNLHLATRIVHSGAGGLDPTHPGLRPVLSPRACRLVVSFNAQGSYSKSLVFAKPAHYCRGYRLHVFSGESLLSARASYLKYATTALVAALCDTPGFRPVLASFGSPIRALRIVNRDTSLSVRLRLSDGRCLTALGIQRLIAAAIETRLPQLPPWAPDALHAWHQVLDDLETLGEAAQRSLDWPIYLQLLRSIVSELGFSEEKVRRVNQGLVSAHAGDGAPAAAKERMDELRATGDALYVDLHVMEAGSLFERLESAGWARIRIPGVTEQAIETAMTTPPAGRAAARARLIQEQSGRSGIAMTWIPWWTGIAERRRGFRRLALPARLAGQFLLLLPRLGSSPSRCPTTARVRIWPWACVPVWPSVRRSVASDVCSWHTQSGTQSQYAVGHD